MLATGQLREIKPCASASIDILTIFTADAQLNRVAGYQRGLHCQRDRDLTVVGPDTLSLRWRRNVQPVIRQNGLSRLCTTTSRPLRCSHTRSHRWQSDRLGRRKVQAFGTLRRRVRVGHRTVRSDLPENLCAGACAHQRQQQANCPFHNLTLAQGRAGDKRTNRLSLGRETPSQSRNSWLRESRGKPFLTISGMQDARHHAGDSFACRGRESRCTHRALMYSSR